MQYHLLNGDALLQRFPDSVPGVRIVLREALIDGPADGDVPEGFIRQRAAFIQEAYPSEPGRYERLTVPDLRRILALPPEAAVYLWFEDDLFCQVHLWFLAWLLDTRVPVAAAYRTGAGLDLRTGFGGLDAEQLHAVWEASQPLDAALLRGLGGLWAAFRDGDRAALARQAALLEARMPGLQRAAQAHLDCFPADGSPGRPERVLAELLRQPGPAQLGQLTAAFGQREPVYGFGDLQIRRLLQGMGLYG
ncbi:MAG: hypothetical protein NW241_04390 [Bacteroidia bacterium]|nr:hypothetical protein [Bacteroidia bacterium]